jgi:FtsZ-binding cell division protein ZapB
MFLTASLTLGWPIASAVADCKTDKEQSWLCKGDKAWVNGYLVLPKVLNELVEKEELFKSVLEERDQFQGQRDEFEKQRDWFKDQRDGYQDQLREVRELYDNSKALRDEYHLQRDNMEAELEIVEAKHLEQQVQIADLQAELSDSWSPLEVGLLVGGVSVLSVLAGAGVYALVVTFK